MKRHVQEPGIRKWSGNDLLDLQGEPLKVLDAFLSQWGDCVVCGCETSGNTIAAGLVSIGGQTLPVPRTEVKAWPAYLVAAEEHIQREYADNSIRDIAVNRYAEVVYTKPGNDTACIEIAPGSHKGFFERMKTSWLAAITNSISSLATGVQELSLPSRSESDANQCIEQGVYPDCTDGMPAGTQGSYVLVVRKSTTPDSRGYYTVEQTAYGHAESAGKVYKRLLFTKDDGTVDRMDWINCSPSENKMVFCGIIDAETENSGWSTQILSSLFPNEQAWFIIGNARGETSGGTVKLQSYMAHDIHPEDSRGVAANLGDFLCVAKDANGKAIFHIMPVNDAKSPSDDGSFPGTYGILTPNDRMDIDNAMMQTYSESNMDNALKSGFYPYCTLGRPAGSEDGDWYTCAVERSRQVDGNGFFSVRQTCFLRRSGKPTRIYARLIFYKPANRGEDNYGEWTEVSNMKVNALPENYMAGEDGLLYADRGYECIVPMSHPDYSTQPSILPQRFGVVPVCEQLVPMRKKSRRGAISSHPTLDKIRNALDYLRNWVDGTFYSGTYFSIATGCMDDASAAKANGILVVCGTEAFCITPDKNFRIDYKSGISEVNEESMKGSLSQDLDNAEYAIVIPVVSVFEDAAYNYVSEDCYLHPSKELGNFLEGGLATLNINVLRLMKTSYPDYNLNHIAEEALLGELSRMAGSTILDARLICQSGSYAPAHVRCRKSIAGVPSLYIKPVAGGREEYDWLIIQYTEGRINVDVPDDSDYDYCYTSK